MLLDHPPLRHNRTPIFALDLEGFDVQSDGNPASPRLLNRISHEVRTPLNALLNLHELLQDSGLNAEQAQLLGNARDACVALQKAVDTLLAIGNCPPLRPITTRVADHRGKAGSTTEPDPMAQLPLQGRTLLVVDDNEVGRRVTCMQLERLGAAVECAQDGLSCIALLTRAGQAMFDCILMDVHMPGLDGPSTTRLIHALPGFAEQRVVALSAAVGESEIQDVLASGIDAFLAKPFDRAALAACLVTP